MEIERVTELVGYICKETDLRPQTSGSGSW